MFAAALGLLGLLLTIVGIYRFLSYSASQRTHETSIRVALGARRGAVLELLVAQGLLLVLAGPGIGFVAMSALRPPPPESALRRQAV